MSPEEAEDLAGRVLAAIDRQAAPHADTDRVLWTYAADRERVASDLAGLREHEPFFGPDGPGCEYCHDQHGGAKSWPCPDGTRYADNLRRTAALYGITP